jgi:hypothetical protein
MIFDGKDRVLLDVCNELTLYDCTINILFVISWYFSFAHNYIAFAQVQKLNFIAIKTENNSVTFQDSIKNRSRYSFLNL